RHWALLARTEIGRKPAVLRPDAACYLGLPLITRGAAGAPCTALRGAVTRIVPHGPRLTFAAGFCLLAVTISGTLEAQTPAPPPRQIKFTANAGFVDAAGNSEITTLSGDERVEYRPAGTGWT